MRSDTLSIHAHYSLVLRKTANLYVVFCSNSSDTGGDSTSFVVVQCIRKLWFL